MIEIVILFFELIFSLGVIAFNIIAAWKMFEKAGQPGWASLIPLYETYVKFKIAGKKKMGIWAGFVLPCIAIALCIAIILLVLIATPILIGLAEGTSELSAIGLIGILFYIGIICLFALLGIASFILNVFCAYGLSKNFGVHWAFTLGLLFYPAIFTAILAFVPSIQYTPTYGDVDTLNTPRH